MVIRRVSPLSVAKVVGLVYAVIGLIVGGIVSLVIMTVGTAATEQFHNPAFGMIFGAGAVVLFPLFYGIGGAIFAAIGAAIYNLVAGMIGGIEIDVEGVPAVPR